MSKYYSYTFRDKPGSVIFETEKSWADAQKHLNQKFGPGAVLL